MWATEAHLWPLHWPNDRANDRPAKAHPAEQSVITGCTVKCCRSRSCGGSEGFVSLFVRRQFVGTVLGRSLV